MEKCVATLILAKLMWSKNMNFSLRSIEINARKICCQYFQSLNLFIKVPDGSQLWKVLISCQFCVVHPTKWSICGRLVQLTQAVNILVQGQLLTYNEIRHEDEEPGQGHQCRHCHSRGIVLHNIALPGTSGTTIVMRPPPNMSTLYLHTSSITSLHARIIGSGMRF